MARVENFLDKSTSKNKTVVEKKIKSILLPIDQKIADFSSDVALYESKFITTLIGVGATTPTRKQVLTAIVNASLANNYKNYTIKSGAKKLRERISSKLSDELVTLNSSGLSDREAKQQIKTVLNTTVKFWLKTYALTAINKAAAVGKSETYKENNINRVMWTTELDSEVCAECEVLYSEIMSVDEFEETCPLHFNCRCVGVPIIE